MRPALDYWLKAHALGTAAAAGLALVANRGVEAVALRRLGRGLSTRAEPLDWESIFSTYDVISLDVFDTLIARRVLNPDAIHLVVARLALDEAHRAQWPRVRAQAEHLAREASARPDVTLTEIYDQVRRIGPDLDSRALQASELATEVRLATATRRGKTIWDTARAAGKAVVVSTDVYLPRGAVADLLHASGYEGWTALYVSGDDGTSKYDGSTFARFAHDFPGRRVLHIGDNMRSDVLAARTAGIDAQHLRRPVEPGRLATTRVGRSVERRLRPFSDPLTALQRSILGSLTESWLDRATSPRTAPERIGYEVLGPSLVGFSQYLEREAHARSLSRIVFLAREGALLRRAFETYTSQTDFETDYAVVSTRLLGVAQLSASVTEADIQFLTKSPVPIRAREYVLRVLPDVGGHVDRIMLESGISPDGRLSSIAAAKQLRPIFRRLSRELGALAETQSEATVAYLDSLCLNDGGSAIVDVGWQGTIQRSISHLIGFPVLGLYWGLRRTALTTSMGSIGAWVDQRRGGADARLFSPLFRFTPAFEVLLANTGSGSAAGVHLSRTNEAGSRSYEFSYMPLEFTGPDRAVIQTIQSAALQFVEDFGALSGTVDAEVLALRRGIAHRRLVRLLERPSPAQVATLRTLSFDGTYGVTPHALGNWWVPPEVRRGR